MIRILTTVAVAILFMASCSPKIRHIADVDNQNLNVANQEIEPDAKMEAFIAPYRNEVKSEMDVVIGTAVRDLTKAKLNSTMGNFFTDLLKESATTITKDEDIAFAVQNYGGLRIPNIPQGEITKGRIFELMPFDNFLVICHMQASTVQSLCDRIADYGGWPVSNGITFTIDGNKATDVNINGEPLQTGKTYKVAMSDYIAGGGDKCSFPADMEVNNTGVMIREAIIQAIEAKTQAGIDIDAANDIRITKQ